MRHYGLKDGFTIIELLIVIVIIAILAAITIVAYNGITAKANTSAALADATEVAKQIATYVVSNGDQYPATLAAANVNTSGNATYQYTPNQTGGDYCVTATVNGVSANVGGFGSGVNPPAMGPCPGHTGTAPTTLDDGLSCPSGFIVVPGNSMFGTKAFCVMKYDAKNDGSGHPQSVAAGTPWTNITQTSAITASQSAVDQSDNAISGGHLITEAEWMTIAANVMSVSSNWSGGAVGSGSIYSGHNDNAPANALAADTNDANGYAGETNTGGNQRRTLTLTNGQVIWDFAGNVYQWTQGTIAGGQQPGIAGESSYSWKDWNNGSLQWNGLAASSRSSAASSAAAGYNWAQGIGELYSNAGETNTHVFLRGGNWYSSLYAGALSLSLANTASLTTGSVGFRVAK